MLGRECPIATVNTEASGYAWAAVLDGVKLMCIRLLRTSNQQFISSQSPHNGVTKETLARWIKLTLTKSGRDTSIFKAHSTRAAAASAAVRTSDVSLVLRSAGWTKETAFAVLSQTY
ncbi:tyrosine recombinase xerc [Plakobranchus ocellatus]|uniref:Tyrosine recombinase xerc n=1 Tax=Plakobranchus ocellatus TaxID=259542 RepID=A0AAV3ZTA2_9GAST|nr:tyrosine recombinase xerc [Plakobranchus ocellatus]